MSEAQIGLVAFALIATLAAPFAASRRWLHPHWLLLAGAAIVIALRLANIPQIWFSGSVSGFAVAIATIAAAFAGRTPNEQSIRMPFLLGFGITMFALNIASHV